MHKDIIDDQVKVGVVTISDTRDYTTDRGGERVQKFLEEQGYEVTREIVKDDIIEIRNIIDQFVYHPSIHAVVTTGGTGIAYRDVSIEAIEPLYDKKIDGFGEIFRYLSYTEDIGSKAILSRATAGVINSSPIFVLPGSVKAVELAMSKLILPELHHCLNELHK
ncbi:MogA/MoaB family molybdenum cofactor biosynthesis protein [Alkalibacillus aidingensis]|uniref:MogA/MoaB family molybdenum cofactor biosynthesis protein n=1 Tax=Alkalibacillus aidingensis TaxID=2747607 RepID=UPI001660F80D|nr:MogA/MoaB family molybdenum cofactor biosynthesis protein [Alkalibacillus aidingensis]